MAVISNLRTPNHILLPRTPDIRDWRIHWLVCILIYFPIIISDPSPLTIATNSNTSASPRQVSPSFSYIRDTFRIPFLNKALYYYDYFLTFSREIELAWPCRTASFLPPRRRRAPTLLSFLYFVNRYLTFFVYIPDLFFAFASPIDNAVRA